MKSLVLFSVLSVLSLAFAQTLTMNQATDLALADTSSQALKPATSVINIDTAFHNGDLVIIDQLVSLALSNNPAVLKAKRELQAERIRTEPINQFVNALSISGGVNMSGDFYGQSSTGYSVTISLNLIPLLENEPSAEPELRASIRGTQQQVRQAVVEAYTAYKIAMERSEIAVLAMQTSQQALRNQEAELEVGLVSAWDVYQSRTSSTTGALNLLTANAEVMRSLEGLASVVGVSAREVAGVVRQGALAQAE